MNEKIRVALVDDHEDSRDVLQELLSEHTDIEVVAAAENAESALRCILKHLPDVVFLDVEMPDKSGLDVLDELKRNGFTPNIIFTTGYHDYAIQAVRERAFDYLLKPIDMDELAQCLTRLRISMKRNNNAEVRLMGQASADPPRLRFATRSGFVLVDPDEVVYCRADGNFTEIYYGQEEKEILSIQMGKIEPVLCDSSLKRIGRSYIINTRYIKEVDRKKQKCFFQKNGHTFSLKLSYNYLKQLGEVLEG